MWLLNYQSEEVRIQEGEKAIFYFILLLARRSKGFFPIIGAEHNLCQAFFPSRFLFQGAFQETEYFERPLHYAMQSEDKLNISLTAHVLIALTETADKLTGDVKRFSNTGQCLAPSGAQGVTMSACSSTPNLSGALVSLWSLLRVFQVSFRLFSR